MVPTRSFFWFSGAVVLAVAKDSISTPLWMTRIIFDLKIACDRRPSATACDTAITRAVRRGVNLCTRPSGNITCRVRTSCAPECRRPAPPRGDNHDRRAHEQFARRAIEPGARVSMRSRDSERFA